MRRQRSMLRLEPAARSSSTQRAVRLALVEQLVVEPVVASAACRRPPAARPRTRARRGRRRARPSPATSSSVGTVKPRASRRAAAPASTRKSYSRGVIRSWTSPSARYAATSRRVVRELVDRQPVRQRAVRREPPREREQRRLAPGRAAARSAGDERISPRGVTQPPVAARAATVPPRLWPSRNGGAASPLREVLEHGAQVVEQRVGVRDRAARAGRLRRARGGRSRAPRSPSATSRSATWRSARCARRARARARTAPRRAPPPGRRRQLSAT